MLRERERESVENIREKFQVRNNPQVINNGAIKIKLSGNFVALLSPLGGNSIDLKNLGPNLGPFHRTLFHHMIFSI